MTSLRFHLPPNSLTWYERADGRVVQVRDGAVVVADDIPDGQRSAFLADGRATEEGSTESAAPVSAEHDAGDGAEDHDNGR